MYSTLEFDSLKRCSRCGALGNLNLERHEVLGYKNGKLVIVDKGKLVYHCRTCGCNTEAL